ncbi:MAG: SDR family NAD(P)-dependent oxidoreductase [Myxococcales bacterium]|nr:SDR family NAD(P)-dependent oxidoreductase [Myxococcales bacterium]USN51246.1 MAG: SDR family NAD(P)-dependent oxidoreductase [Myxococcales bacterium]
MELSYAAAKKFKAQKKGTIINIASTAAFSPIPYAAVYAASKSFKL